MNPRTALALALILFVAAPAETRAQKPSFIRLAEVDGRQWLIDPAGNPFFAHGVTHLSNPAHGLDVRKIGEACKQLGFNAYGCGCPHPLKADLPYLEGRQFVPMSTYSVSGGGFGFVDIFDPAVRAELEDAVKKMCFANRKNPNLIGYCWTDLGAWPLKNETGSNWVKFIRALPANAPGRKAYAAFLSKWRGEDADARDLAFLTLIAREYFRVLGEANRRFDPDHLVFGDRFSFNTIVPEVIKEMLPHVDAIAIQPPYRPGFPKAKFEEIHRLTGKPILLCDFAIRFKDGDKNIRGYKPEESPALAGQRYAEYIRAALATPYILGAFWCNPVDSAPGFNKTGVKQGIFDKGLTPRPDLNQAIRELNGWLRNETPKP
jgi:hypothetical protein